MQFLGYDYAYPFTVESNTGEIVTETQSLRVVATSVGAHRWDLSIPLVPTRAPGNQMAELAAHRMEHGVTTPFDIPFPALTQDYNAIALATVTGVQKNSTVFFLPAVAMNNGAVRVGMAIKFANHAKIYIVTSMILIQVLSNQFVEVGVKPSLNALLPDGTAIDKNPNIRVTYAPDSQAVFNAGRDTLFRPRIDVVEYLG